MTLVIELLKLVKLVAMDNFSYYEGYSECELGAGKIWTEFSGIHPIRQIEQYGAHIFTSLSEGQRLGPSLLEGTLDELDLSNSGIITLEAFEEKWKEAVSASGQQGNIRYRSGDASIPYLKGALIAHIVNDQGKWGKGFVLSLSQKWPASRAAYLDWASGHCLFSPAFVLGEVQFVEVELRAQVVVANMLAQQGIRNNYKDKKRYVDYDALKKCLSKIARYCLINQLKVQMPRIGTGLAGGDWPQIETLIQSEITSRGVDVLVVDWAEVAVG